jgi:hypothetical protein
MITEKRTMLKDKKGPVSFPTREVTRHMSTKWRRVEPTTLSRKGGMKTIPAFLMAVGNNIAQAFEARHKKIHVKKVF